MSENLHPRADELDELSALDFVRLMHAEDATVVEAIAPRLEQVARAVEAIADRLRAGGKLHYFGAGTSGLIAKLDAAECPSTFGVDGELVQAHAVEEPEREDDRDLGRDAASSAQLGERDVAVGISASGRTPYVLGAFDQAASVEAFRVAITCNPGSPLGRVAHVAIEVETGPEVIAGSTRLKAGTVEKLVLNMLSTTVFTRLAHTHRGRMVGVVAGNDKLRARATLVVAGLAGVEPEQAERALESAGGNPKVAIVMLQRGLSADEARGRLRAASGDLRVVLTEARRA